MKRPLFFLFALFLSAAAMAQDSLNMTLLSRWDDEALPDANYGGTPFSYAGCYGYAANGREYAILCSSANIHVIDVTDPAQPVEIDRFPGGATTVWREAHIYQHHLYTITDNASEGMMIFDLSQLPNEVTKVKQTTEFFSSAHTLFVDQATGRLYINGANNGVIILDLTVDPANPTLLANHPNLPGGGYIHDMYVDNNIGFGSHGFNGLYIWDFSDPLNPVSLASIETNGYCHSNWPTSDGKYLLIADEVPRGLPLVVVDIEEMQSGSVEIVKQFTDPVTPVSGAAEKVTYHNPYILGTDAILASYFDGVVIFDLSDPLNPVRKAYYDTFGNSSYNAYNGCWGAYPYLPSGNIIASDIQGGLFMLKQISPTSPSGEVKKPFEVSIFPNPVATKTVVRLPKVEKVRFELLTLDGKLLREGEFLHTLNLLDMTGLIAGNYLVRLTNPAGESTVKQVVKQ